MYKILLISSLIILAVPGKTQQIRKMKITELESYIEKADHPLLVNFWATYCVPCMEEMPDLINITEKYKREGVELLMVSLDMPKFYPGKIESFAKEKRLPRGVIWLDESNADYFCPKIDTVWSGAIPATLFINHQTGYRRFLERQISSNELQKIFAEMMSSSKKANQHSTALNRASD